MVTLANCHYRSHTTGTHTTTAHAPHCDNQHSNTPTHTHTQDTCTYTHCYRHTKRTQLTHLVSITPPFKPASHLQSVHVGVALCQIHAPRPPQCGVGHLQNTRDTLTTSHHDGAVGVKQLHIHSCACGCRSIHRHLVVEVPQGGGGGGLDGAGDHVADVHLRTSVHKDAAVDASVIEEVKL